MRISIRLVDLNIMFIRYRVFSKNVWEGRFIYQIAAQGILYVKMYVRVIRIRRFLKILILN